MPNQVLDFLADFVLGLAGVLRKPIDSISNSNCVGVQEGMGEIAKSIEDAPEHPNIDFVADLVLQVGINYFGRPVHRSGNRLDLLLDQIVLAFVNLAEIDHSVRARAEIAQLERVVLPDQDVLDLDVLMVVASVVDRDNSSNYRVQNQEQLLLTKAFILMLLEQVEQSAVWAKLH